MTGDTYMGGIEIQGSIERFDDGKSLVSCSGELRGADGRKLSVQHVGSLVDTSQESVSWLELVGQVLDTLSSVAQSS